MKIAVSTVDFLGAVIGEGTIKLQPHIIKKIVNFNEEELKTKKGLRSFLGILNYARNHIPKLGILLRPLYEKTNAHGDKRLKPSDYELVRKIKEQVQNLLTWKFHRKMLTSSWKQMDAWKDGEERVKLETKGRKNQELSNTSYMGFQYSKENVVDYLITSWLTRIPLVEKRSIDELEGMSLHIKHLSKLQLRLSHQGFCSKRKLNRSGKSLDLKDTDKHLNHQDSQLIRMIEKEMITWMKMKNTS
ncbi:hypothetical protein Tco_0588425 [Tanacetum coccineum]